MKRVIPLLTLGLLAQLALAVGLMWQGAGNWQQAPRQTLIELSGSEPDRLLITDGGDSVELQRAEDTWRLSATDLPADGARVAEVLNELTTARVGLPVAQTSASQIQLEVAPEKFQKRVQAFSGNRSLVDLYLGTSPGFRRTHARLAGSEDIYASPIASYSITAASDDWLDKALLAVTDVQQVQFGDLVLKKTDAAWQLAEGISLDAVSGAPAQGPIEQLVQTLASLRVVNTVQDGPIEADWQSLKILTSQRDYEYHLAVQNDEAWVRRQDRDTVFKIPVASADNLLALTTDRLWPPNSGDAPIDAPIDFDQVPAGKGSMSVR